jgi:Conjugal transfer protein
MKSLFCVAMVLLMGGCSAWQTKPHSTPVPASYSKYEFDYSVTNGEPISLIRTFDDGGSTYFQFRSNPPEALVISAQSTAGEAIIPHEVMGNYAVIRGVYRHSSIPTAAQSVMIRKLGFIAPMASMGPVILPKAVTELLTKNEPKPLPVAANDPDRHSSGTHRIRFPRNSSVLGPAGRLALAELVATAINPSEIEIRVRPFYSNRKASIRLAEARAATIRKALVKGGVADAAIRVLPQSGTQILIAEVEVHAPAVQAIDEPKRVRVGHVSDLGAVPGAPFTSGPALKFSSHI